MGQPRNIEPNMAVLDATQAPRETLITAVAALRGEGISYSLSAGVLTVPEDHAAFARQLLDPNLYVALPLIKAPPIVARQRPAVGDARVASRARRLAASLIDAVPLILTFAIVAVATGERSTAYLVGTTVGILPHLPSVWDGQSLGKLVARIRIVQYDTGAPASRPKLGIRLLLTLFSDIRWVLPLVLVAVRAATGLSNITLALFHPDRRTLWDMICGTVVVDAAATGRKRA